MKSIETIYNNVFRLYYLKKIKLFFILFLIFEI